MSLCSICIEVRKNLRCANVFLQFDKSLTETECLKINVDRDALCLGAEGAMKVHIPLLPHLTVEARTLSNLTVDECNASFRLTVASLIEAADMQQTQAKPIEPQLLECDNESCLHCANCLCALLTAPQLFQRVLEFPSGSIDMGEFFCHHGPDFSAALVPKNTDIFYGFHFVVLNSKLLRTHTIDKESHLYCRRCLQYLGETLFEGNAAKLWADTLRLKCSNEEDLKEVFSCAHNNKPTYELMHKIMSDCAAVEQPTPLLQQMQFSKVLLEATFPSRQRQYLLLHILEKQLPVLRNLQPITRAQQLPIVEGEITKHLELTPCQCIKLLYRMMHATPEGVGPKALLATWRKDISIHSLQVSPMLFSALLTELEENTLLLPELYRYTREDFQLSYVF